MTLEPYRTWIERWEKTLAAVRAVGAEVIDFSIGPPATEAEIVATERTIGRLLPPALRRVFREFSGSVYGSWYLPTQEGMAEAIMRNVKKAILGRPEDPLRVVPGGNVGLSLGGVEGAERARRLRYEVMRRRQSGEWEDERLARWARSIAWWSQDDIAVAFDPDDSGAAVLLDDYTIYVDSLAWLAPDFMEFMDRWTRIGCVSPMCLDNFILENWGGLDPDCESARRWREALKLDL